MDDDELKKTLDDYEQEIYELFKAVKLVIARAVRDEIFYCLFRNLLKREREILGFRDYKY